MDIKGITKVNELLYYGLLSLILGYVLEKYGSGYSSVIPYLTSLFSSIGVALVIIALVESRHLKKYLESTSEKIVYESSNKLDKKFKESFKLLKQCDENGLVEVLPPRQDTSKSDETRKIIAKEIEKTNLVYIFSISGLDFFNYIRGPGSGSGLYYEIILERLDKAKKEGKPLELKIKALLMDPKSKAAKFRNEIEKTRIHQSTQDKDLEISIEGIERLNNMNSIPFIEHLQYSEFPQVGFILTDNYVFIEPYHFAPTEILCDALKIEKLLAATLHSNCTGGRIPVFKFQKKSNMYVAMLKHFDSIWDYTEKNIDHENPL